MGIDFGILAPGSEEPQQVEEFANIAGFYNLCNLMGQFLPYLIESFDIRRDDAPEGGEFTVGQVFTWFDGYIKEDREESLGAFEGYVSFMNGVFAEDIRAFWGRMVFREAGLGADVAPLATAFIGLNLGFLGLVARQYAEDEDVVAALTDADATLRPLMDALDQIDGTDLQIVFDA